MPALPKSWTASGSATGLRARAAIQEPLFCPSCSSVAVKGRDFYDLVWYVGRRVPLNLAHLEARMPPSGDGPPETPLDAHSLRKRLEERFASIRFDQAKEDIAPLLKNPRELSLWSEGFFMDLIPLIQIG